MNRFGKTRIECEFGVIFVVLLEYKLVNVLEE